VSRNLRTGSLAIVGFVASLVGCAGAIALLAPSRVAAQVCDEDAGDEDGGAEDAGLTCEPADSGAPPMAEPDASFPDGGGPGVDAGGDSSEACSCDTVTNTTAGTIHVCTGARERYECRYLECTTTIKRDRACPTRSVELCCEMPSRGLYSQLYEDCDHPNCEAGFRAQCHDFGGSITAGACVVEESDPASEDSAGGCRAAPSQRAAGPSTLLALGLAVLVLALRARRHV